MAPEEDRLEATRPPSLLYLATAPAMIRNFYLPYAAHFRKLGWEVHAATSGIEDHPEIAAGFESVHGLGLSRSSRDLGATWRGLVEIKTLARDLQPDLVHVHTPIASLLTRLALGRGRLAQRPAIVYTAHGFHVFEGGSKASNFVYATAEAVAGRWTDALIVINDEDESLARQWHMVGRDRLVRMPGVGVDTDWYDARSVSPESARDFRAAHSIDLDATVYLLIAELHKRKRPLDAIRALAAMRRRDAHLAVLGEGPLMPAMRAFVAECGLESRVHFCGFLDDVRPALASATATVLTSEREGLPRVIMESLSMGVPVVTTTARGCAELVGDAGLVVPTGDVHAIAEALDQMDSSAAEWNAMAMAARPRMMAKYRLHGVIEMHEQLYRRLLAARADAIRQSGGDMVYGGRPG